MKSIGVIGTGIMGGSMAENLLKAGYSVYVFNRTKSRTDHLIQAGAKWMPSPAELASNVNALITCLPDSPDVMAVYLGDEGICHGLQPNTLCIDMSTIAPETARMVASKATEKGGVFLDAPVSGGKTGAESGTLSIMVGGEEKDVARAKPIFEVVGKSLVHCGPVGHGQLTKLCNQILCGLNLLGVSEAITFAKRVGLNPETMLQAVSTGAAGSWALDNLGTRMIRRDFDPMFMVDLQQKDLRIALSTASREKVSLPGTAMVNQLLTANQAADEGREGTQALIKVIERLSSLTAS